MIESRRSQLVRAFACRGTGPPPMQLDPRDRCLRHDSSSAMPAAVSPACATRSAAVSAQDPREGDALGLPADRDPETQRPRRPSPAEQAEPRSAPLKTRATGSRGR